MRFTVYETTHSYKVWKEVEAESKDALMVFIGSEGIEALGEPNDEEVTSIEVDIYSE